MPTKQNNEITVKIKGSIDDLIENICKKGFKLVDEFTIEDNYFIPNNLDLNKSKCRQILTKAIILRSIEDFTESTKTKLITFKKKDIDKNGEILSQKIFNIKVEDLNDAQNLFYAIGYNKIMQIYEKDKVYEKDGFAFAIKDIKNGDKLIEAEINENNEEINSIDKLKQIMKKYNIPIYTDNYFVKKAEIELEKILKSGKI